MIDPFGPNPFALEQRDISKESEREAESENYRNVLHKFNIGAHAALNSDSFLLRQEASAIRAQVIVMISKDTPYILIENYLDRALPKLERSVQEYERRNSDFDISKERYNQKQQSTAEGIRRATTETAPFVQAEKKSSAYEEYMKGPGKFDLDLGVYCTRDPETKRRCQQSFAHVEKVVEIFFDSDPKSSSEVPIRETAKTSTPQKKPILEKDSPSSTRCDDKLEFVAFVEGGGAVADFIKVTFVGWVREGTGDVDKRGGDLAKKRSFLSKRHEQPKKAPTQPVNEAKTADDFVECLGKVDPCLAAYYNRDSKTKKECQQSISHVKEVVEKVFASDSKSRSEALASMPTKQFQRNLK